ncbi:MAG: SdpI family protein [Chthoniobacterales bacterium]|nr:SdpI family protein [Chthoniobacterales bacterium]
MKTKLGWLEIVLLSAPFLALAIYWNDLPARVPTHWDFRGEINGWMSKVPGILIVPLTALGITALLHFLPRLDPKLRRRSGDEGLMPAVMPIVRLATLVLLDTIFAVQMAASLGKNVAAGRIMMTCLLLFFVILGNYLGNLRPNYFVGIRTPWTLENPETWRATHRLGGRLMFFGALVLLGAEIFLSESAFGLLFVSSILALAAWGFAYSWHHCRTHAGTS